MTAYHSLEKQFARISALSGASSILEWDCATMMQDGSAPVRAEQMSQISELSHELITHPKVGEWLAKAEAESSSLTDWQKANLREMRRSYIHQTAVDAELVGALSKACSASEHYWRTARKENDLKGFLAHLEPVLSLTREMAQRKGEAMGLAPYDALIDAYDPGSSMANIDAAFAPLEAFLPSFIPEVLEKQAARAKALPVSGPFDISAQKELGKKIMGILGFDFNRGRLDISAHPFCGGVPGDVRITTRYNTDNFTESLYGVVHETGHALYEFGLPEAWRGQPVGQALGMAMHESQSLLVEMQLARSLPFLEFAAPLMREAFNVSGPAWEADNLYHLLTVVERSLIRVGADEVTYPCHILLRYDLEKKLIAGMLSVKDIPDAWNEGMRALLGIVPATHADGCMQDVHWPGGSFGYFPSYTLGAMIAAQLFDYAQKNIKDLALAIKTGNFAPLTGWLRANVHESGSLLTVDGVLEKATGRKLDPQVFIAHLKQRYLS